MAKNNKSTKDVSKLTPEERIAQLEAENAKLKGMAGKPAINPRKITFETEDEGSYRFTCQKFNMDGVEYDALEVIESENMEVLAKLVAMKSGIIEKIEE